MSCPTIVGLLESVVQCELPAGHADRGQPVHAAVVYGDIGDRSVPVSVKWVDVSYRPGDAPVDVHTIEPPC